MDTLVNISQFLLGLSLLIILHEMGHFLPAKWFKTRVEKFYLFFDAPPFGSLLSFKSKNPKPNPLDPEFKGTEYGLGWLPLGGYVKISGMVDESMDTEALKEPPKPWEFRSKPAWQRLIIMLGGVTVNFLLGFFIYAMMLWYYGKAYVPTEQLRDGLAFDSLLINQGFRNGDLILKVGNQPFERLDPGTFVENLVLDNERQVTIRRDGQVQTLSLNDDVARQLTGQRVPKGQLMSPRMPFVVDEVSAGLPAEKAGLKMDDRILALDGQPTLFFDEFAPLAQQRKGQPINLTILRGADTSQVGLTLTEQGTIGVRPKGADAYYKVERERYSLGQALPGGVRQGMDFLDNQMKAFGQMFKGKIAVKDNLGSLISISKMYGTSWDWERFWSLTAALSIILAFMNLLPIPALDGGYVMFLLWEVFTGKKVSDKFMEKAVTVGFFLLLALMVFALGNDVWKHWLQRFF